MSKDQMQDVFAVNFDFKKGEQPSHIKLSGWVKQTNSAFSDITRSIGDPWMYQSHGDRELSPEKLAQASLARIIGPSDWLSPHGASWNESCNAVISLSPNRNSWSLGYPLVSVGSMLTPVSSVGDVTSLSATWDTVATFSGAHHDALFSTRKNYPYLVQAPGDYYVDFLAGIITSYSMPGSTISLSITGLCMFGPGVPWATANVIPTWDDGTLCHVVETNNSGGESTYTITFPSVKTGTRSTGSNLKNTKGNVSYNVPAAGADAVHAKYRLPYSIVSSFSSSSSEPVPEGFLLLWDGTRLVPNVRFYVMDDGSGHVDPYKIQAITLADTLTEGATVRIIVTGTSVSEALNYLMNSTRSNTHSGLVDGQDGKTLSYTSPLTHYDLADRFGGSVNYAGTDIDKSAFLFRESLYPTNDHPQYLHRAGYMSEDKDGNTGNAMRGNILFSQEKPAYSSEYSLESPLFLNSYGLRFGAPLDGPRISFHGARDSAKNLPFGINGIGILKDTSHDTYGALTIRAYENMPLYLHSSDNTPYNAGASIAFDYGSTHEMNYIKLLPGNRIGNFGDPVNLPANLGQTSWATTLPMTPDLDNSLHPYQVREWRFRGVPWIGGATNRGLGDIGRQYYFTSPGMVGADFLNVYSNAIFFSEEGDGKLTSWHTTGCNWFVDHSQPKPIGMYYMPDGDASTSLGNINDPHYQFYTGSSTSQTYLDGVIGFRRNLLYSHGENGRDCFLSLSASNGSTDTIANLKSYSSVSVTGDDDKAKLDLYPSHGHSCFSLWSDYFLSIGSTSTLSIASSGTVLIGGYIPDTSYNNKFNSSADTLAVNVYAPEITIEAKRDHGETVAAVDCELNLLSAGDININADVDLALESDRTILIRANGSTSNQQVNIISVYAVQTHSDRIILKTPSSSSNDLSFYIENLPTSDPGGSNRVWVDTGNDNVLKINGY